MTKTSKKKLLITSLLCANIALTACTGKEYYKGEIHNITPTFTSIDTRNKLDEISFNGIECKKEIIDENSLDYNTSLVDVIITDDKTPIYNCNNEIIGYFTPEHNFTLLDENDYDYIINYYGTEGFVDKTKTYKSTNKVINTEMVDKGYVKADTPIYDNYDLVDEYATLSKLEFVEIYKELENCYLVQTLDYVGFISKDNVTLLEGNLAVIDRSNQELRLYEDNTMTICTPVVTGTRNTSRESDLGLFSVHTKAENLYIIPGAWVDCVSYYNGGEGIHTACWRTTEEFGGDTYITNGSHGCINTPHDDAMYVHSKLKIRDKVLVKE